MRMRSQTQLEIRVQYNAPVHLARRVLRVLPLERANQSIIAERWQTTPPSDSTQEKADAYGNRRLFVSHRTVESEFRFVMLCEVETSGEPLFDSTPHLGTWKMPSRAVHLTPALQKLAVEGKALPPLKRALHWAQFCHQHLIYTPEPSAIPVLASEIWEAKRGTCADFAHVYLALCRASGLSARYVAGYNPAEGQMHAWAEVWSQGYWHAFDPTHGHVPTPGCVVVGIGRDFYDVPPVAGSFRGRAAAKIQLHCTTNASS